MYNAFYQVLEERDGSNQLLARYTYGDGIDEVLTMERGGSTCTYHRDALDSIAEVTDTSGSLVERYEYDVYGTVSLFDGSGTPLTASTIGNPYLFTARRYDPESGNYSYRARIYSPTLGRFLQMDPLGYVDGINLYACVMSNPVNSSDKFGLKTYMDCGGVSRQYSEAVANYHLYRTLYEKTNREIEKIRRQRRASLNRINRLETQLAGNPGNLKFQIYLENEQNHLNSLTEEYYLKGKIREKALEERLKAYDNMKSFQDIYNSKCCKGNWYCRYGILSFLP